MTDQMEYIGRINKEGSVDDLPTILKKRLYDLIMSIDLDEDDKLRSEGQYGMHQSDEAPGLSVLIYDKKIVVMIKMGVYNLESGLVDDEIMVAPGVPRNDMKRLVVADDIVVAIGIPRNDIERLIKEN
ncbi:hypothetical protein LCGC14_1029720 [marine sediment metagenome]|uniref:Uncharacterized protein n=1 Tax=marine sediment metagenome TaxID=412755 RepID=A0A0F9MUZ7_9ZZZZ